MFPSAKLKVKLRLLATNPDAQCSHITDNQLNSPVRLCLYSRFHHENVYVLTEIPAVIVNVFR